MESKYSTETGIDRMAFHRVGSSESHPFFSYAKIDEEMVLDIVALSEFPARFTYMGDRTVVKNIKRDQWQIAPNIEECKNGISRFPKHGTRKATPTSIASVLLTELRNEITYRLKGKTNVGILLSGGMDSRIVAGILKEIQMDRPEISVTALTWGEPNTRDPVYSKHICDLYHWEYEYFKITPDVLKHNITIAAREGCSFAPQHLHAMVDISMKAKQLSLDCILSGSYGDSIGRAEYSGKKVTQLRAMKSYIRNEYGMINPSLFKKCRRETISEISRYHKMYGKQTTWARNELDYQLHYMRNQLGTCMSVMSKSIPLIQCFTSRGVVEAVWSFHPSCRTDHVYYELINMIDNQLYLIPWARTGKRYLQSSDLQDKTPNSFSRYGDWIRGELNEYLENLIFEGGIEKTAVFNMNQVEYIFDKNKNTMDLKDKRFDEIVLWLASLAVFLKECNCIIEEKIETARNRSMIGMFYTNIYAKRQKHKKR